MLKRIAVAVITSLLLVLPPALGNTDILAAPHLWILLAIGVAASILQPPYNPFTIASSAGDKGTGAQIIWSVYITQWAAIFEAAYLRYPQSIRWDTVAILALAVAILGLLIRTWAVFTLGTFFTMHIAVAESHKVIRRGPFAFMRHPSYLGAFLLYVSTTVFLHAWLSAAATVVILMFAFLRRIYHEESMLTEKLGPEYKSYQEEVKMILPGIW